jgi:hypothetical protein
MTVARIGLLLMLSSSASFSVAAEEAKTKKADKAMDDLFGTPPAPSSMDALKKAAEGPAKESAKGGLVVKNAAAVQEDAPVVLHAVFAAEKIAQDPKLGCQPAGKSKKRVKQWAFDELPQMALPFAVCLTVSSEIGRTVTASVAIVDPRGHKVLHAEDIINFGNNTKRLDHVLEYPAALFKNAGEYFYVLTVDHKEAGRLPLFVVNTGDGNRGLVTE